MLGSHRKSIVEILGRSPIHPFPARMAPGIALGALGGADRLRVLDPMAGSGTVLAVARAHGHRAIGIDLDPLAVLLATVWTRTIDPDYAVEVAVSVLNRARRDARNRSVAESYPDGTDEETGKFIRYWFDPIARRQLASLADAIGRIRSHDYRDLLWCSFSRLIITKTSGASRAMDLSHSRPHRSFERAPVKPFDGFLSAVEAVATNCPTDDPRQKVGPVARVLLGDARSLPLPPKSIDLVLTSPPYLNAIDYMRCSKFTLVWMGYSIDRLRSIRGESIGCESSLDAAAESHWVRDVTRDLRLRPALSSRHYALLCHYVWDMGAALSEAARVLAPGGRAVYVVGDSTIRGTFVRNSSVVAAVGQLHGLQVRFRASRALPANHRYLPPPRRTGVPGRLDDRMRRETVLEFRKDT